jgi:hypothetical protein
VRGDSQGMIVLERGAEFSHGEFHWEKSGRRGGAGGT